jgi:copper resistance protein B
VDFKMSKRKTLIAATLLSLGVTPAWAQSSDPGGVEAAPMDHSQHGVMPEAMPGMIHDMNHDMNHDMAAPEAMPSLEMEGMDHGSMDHGSMDHGSMDHGSMGTTEGSMPAESDAVELRDPHAYSDGFDFGPIPRPRLADEHHFGALRIDRLENVQSKDGSELAYDLQGRIGRDYDGLLLKVEGEVDGGELHDSRSEMLWRHAVSAFWDTQLGARFDSGVDPDRAWLAFGLQGLAPYWFEVDATAYVADEGRSALRLAAEYELLFTQQVVLQPRAEASFYGKADADRGEGAGLAQVTAGLRLRYEIRRELAPYIGIEWDGQFGDTADYARNAGVRTAQTHYVAGLRLSF